MGVTKSVQKLVAYTPGEQPKCRGVVKLNTNENPYPPSPKCLEVLKNFDLEYLRKYPDPVFVKLREAIAKRFKTTIDKVFVGNGSDEILSIAAKAFVENDESIGSLDPSYSLYKTLADIRDVPWGGFDLASLSRTSRAARTSRPSLFLLTNPNAPTGVMKNPKEIEDFAKKFKGVVIVDEAYADFAAKNCMHLATKEGNENLIVMRTFSKSFSLAGLRVGFCVGPEKLIEAMYKVKDSYNVDALAQAIALAAFKDFSYMKSNVKKVVAEREKLTKALVSRGWDVLPSETNFIFAKPPEGQNAADIFVALKKKKIFVRYFPGPKTGDRLRITIGTPEQMAKLLKALTPFTNH